MLLWRHPIMQPPQSWHPDRAGPAPSKYGSGTSTPGSPKNTPTFWRRYVSPFADLFRGAFDQQIRGEVGGHLGDPEHALGGLVVGGERRFPISARRPLRDFERPRRAAPTAYLRRPGYRPPRRHRTRPAHRRGGSNAGSRSKRPSEATGTFEATSSSSESLRSATACPPRERRPSTRARSAASRRPNRRSRSR